MTRPAGTATGAGTVGNGCGDVGRLDAPPAWHISSVPSPHAHRREPSIRRAVPYLAAYCCYQALALAAWWHLLAHGISTTLPAGSADPAQEAWFLAWLPHALGTGANPFFSHAVFSPAGVNLLDNTSTELLGLVLSPVTVIAGPVASLGVAVLMAPSLSALGAFALCRRYVTWAPAAFAGGLCYGFGSFLATDLRFAHIDLTWLVLPPLIFLFLDELLVRRLRRPVPTGVVLGILIVAQFFVSTEMLAITAIMCLVAIVVVALARPRSIVPVLRHAWGGLTVAVAIPGAALAYPIWMVAAGPRHVTGAVWRGVGQIAATLGAAVFPHGEVGSVAFISGGNGSYLGVGLLVVLVAGTVAFWRSAPLRTAIALLVLAYVASLGYDLHAGKASLHVPLPAAVLGHVPLLDSIVPERFSAMVDLFAGLALAIVVDHARRGFRGSPATGSQPNRSPATRSHPLRLVLAAGAVVLALVPLAFAPPWPYATATLRQPPVVKTVAVAAKSPPVVVIYPAGWSAVADEMVWQAQDGYAFTLPNGYAIVPGPGGRAVLSPRLNAVWLVFAGAALHRLHLPLSASALRAVRHDLRAMHTAEVIVLPGAAGSGTMRHVVTASLGPPSSRLDGAWLWVLRSSPGR